MATPDEKTNEKPTPTGGTNRRQEPPREQDFGGDENGASPKPPKGVFELQPGDAALFDSYNISSLSADEPVPDDQARLQVAIYETRGILKLLREQGMLGKVEEDPKRPEIAAEFSKRIEQVAKAGLVGQVAQVALATLALQSIRSELLARKGRKVIYLYLSRLAKAAATGVAFGFAMELAVGCVVEPGMRGYGNVLMGAMVGGWLSAAANRRDVTLDQLPDFLASPAEPWIRMGFVGLLAWAAAAFVQKEILEISVGGADFATFPNSPKLAFCLGLVAGIGERALSIRLLNRVSRL
jgi:hypothetical protein